MIHGGIEDEPGDSGRKSVTLTCGPIITLVDRLGIGKREGRNVEGGITCLGYSVFRGAPRISRIIGISPLNSGGNR